MTTKKKMQGPHGVLLIGGGLDSLAALEYSLESDTPVEECFFFSYGNNLRTQSAAQAIALYYKLPCSVFPLSLPASYTTVNRKLPYLPDRNLIFLAYTSALSKLKFGEGSQTLIYTGFRRTIDSIYDSKPPFTLGLNSILARDPFASAQVFSPFEDSSRSEIISYLHSHPHAPLQLSYSCYNETELHCGLCMTCVSRKKAFQEAMVSDPTRYAA